MKPKDIIKSLQEQRVRTVCDEGEEKWYLAVMDVVRLLTESGHPKSYWHSLRRRVLKEGYTGLSKCRVMILTGLDGRKRKVTVVDLEQFLRLVQSVRHPNAEHWRKWLAQSGTEVIRESYDPERSLDRALDNWRRMGRDEKWILQRMMSQETRNRLTQYWGNHNIKDSDEFRSLTNLIHQGWSRMTVQEHKEMKGLKSQNLRDHMTEAELIFTALAEMAVRQIAECRQAIGYEENVFPAEKGSSIAGEARQQLEKHIGHRIITAENFRDPQDETEKTQPGKKKI